MTGRNNIITTVNITKKNNVINNIDNSNPCTLYSLFCNNIHLFTETLIVIFECLLALTKSTLIVIISYITSKILLYKKLCRISGILHSKCIED